MGEPWGAWEREASSEWASVGIAGGQLHGRQIASKGRSAGGTDATFSLTVHAFLERAGQCAGESWARATKYDGRVPHGGN